MYVNNELRLIIIIIIKWAATSPKKKKEEEEEEEEEEERFDYFSRTCLITSRGEILGNTPLRRGLSTT